MGKIEITLVSNGVIIERDNPNDDGRITEVYPLEVSFPRPEFSELHELQILMYNILDALGYNGSKHDEYRLRVVVEHQHPSERAQEVLNGAAESFDYPKHSLMWETYE